METEQVAVRSTKQDTETILSIFQSRKDRPGVIIEHAELLASLGLRSKDTYFSKVVNRARKLLMDQTGILLEPVWRCGLMVPSGKDQLKRGVRIMQRAQNAFDSADRTIANITEDRLSERERELRMAILAKTRYLAEHMRAKRLGIEAEVGCFEPHPRLAMTG